MVAMITAFLIEKVFVSADVCLCIVIAMSLITTDWLAIFFNWFNVLELSMCVWSWFMTVDKNAGLNTKHERNTDQHNYHECF